MMGNQTAQADHTVSTLTEELVDQWFARAEQIDNAEQLDHVEQIQQADQNQQTGEGLNSSDLPDPRGADLPGADLPSATALEYGRSVLRAAVSGIQSPAMPAGAPPVRNSEAQLCITTYLLAMAAGIRAAWISSVIGLERPEDTGAQQLTGAAPIAVAAGLLAGAAALADASERSDSAEHHLWAPEAGAAAAGAAIAADVAADGADLGVTARAAAFAARNIHHGPTRVWLILAALADVVAPASAAELLVERQLSGAEVAGFRLAFSMDSSRWATPHTLTQALKANCTAFECVEESGVCDVDLLTEAPGPVMELIIGIGTPYHLEIEHLSHAES